MNTKITPVSENNQQLVDKKFKCPYCDKSFETRWQLSLHMGITKNSRGGYTATHDDISLPIKQQDLHELYPTIPKNTDTTFKCPYCDEHPTSKGNLKSHLGLTLANVSAHDDIQKTTRQEWFDANHPSKHYNNDVYICKYCNKSTATRHGLLVHLGILPKSNGKFVQIHNDIQTENKQQFITDCYPLLTKEERYQTMVDGMMKNHGVRTSFLLPEVQIKRKQTFLKKYGHTHPMKNEHIKQKMLTEMYKRKEEIGIPFNKFTPNIGKNETRILDELSEELDIEILRQHLVLTEHGMYFTDGYIPSLNLVIEVDESYHNSATQSEKDLIREQHIKAELDCDILRIPDC